MAPLNRLCQLAVLELHSSHLDLGQEAAAALVQLPRLRRLAVHCRSIEAAGECLLQLPAW